MPRLSFLGVLILLLLWIGFVAGFSQARVIQANRGFRAMLLYRVNTPLDSPATPCPAVIDPALAQQLRYRLVPVQASARPAAYRVLGAGHISCLAGNLEAAYQAWRRSYQLASHDSMALLWASVGAWALGWPMPTASATKDSLRGISRWARERGRGFSGEGDWSRAEDWYWFALALYPNVEAAAELATYFHGQGDTERAVRVWRQVIPRLAREDPDRAWAEGRLAELEQRWSDAAQAYVTGAALTEPRQAYGFLLRAGLMWQRARKWSRAEAVFHRARALAPRRIEAYLRLGHLFRAQKDYAKAMSWYREAAKVAPNRYEPLLFQGIVARDQRRFQEALGYLEQALALRPALPVVWYHKSLVLDALERRGEALRALEQAIALRSDPPETWIAQRDRWQRYPRKEVDPDYWWAQGQSQEQAGEWEIAAALYRYGAARAQPPDDYRLRIREALMWRRLQQEDRATSIYEELIVRYPTQIGAYLGLGDLARSQGRLEEASSWYRRAAQVAPERLEPLFYLGVTAYAAQEYERALEYLEEALALNARHAWSWYYKAITLDALGRRSEAIEALEQAIALHGSPPDAWQQRLQQWAEEVRNGT